MIELSKTSVMNFENAIRGMRNPLQSYEKSDSFYFITCTLQEAKKCSIGKKTCEEVEKWHDYEGGRLYILGKNDLDLAKKLCKAGSDHRKFLRQILVSVDIKAPLYWWKEFDTYKVATVANSTSTMHTIHKKEFTLDDFSCEHLIHGDYIRRELADIEGKACGVDINSRSLMGITISLLNEIREEYLRIKDKDIWYNMIQLLPSSYNQLRTCTLNYEVLRNIYHARKNHKLTEWHDFCRWVESLPYARELITDEADS